MKGNLRKNNSRNKKSSDVINLFGPLERPATSKNINPHPSASQASKLHAHSQLAPT